jgi:predicted RNA-binding Zn-ribbon protein involved in translation (DUF1610 family)
MTEDKQFKGTWAQRLFIIVLGLVLAVLLYWLLGFLMADIESLPGPARSEVEAKYIGAAPLAEQQSLQENLATIRQSLTDKQEQQAILRDRTDSLQNTINQLLSIQKQTVERGGDLSAQEQQALAESQALFLENQKQYQVMNKEIAELTTQQHQLRERLTSISKQIKSQQAEAWKEYDRLRSKHRIKVAALKLAVMVPIFLITAWFFIKKRSGIYWPIVYAAFIAAFVRISLVVHQYFPRKYFKYIALLVIIGIVIRLLIYILMRIVAPKKPVIIRQYQEAYDRGICPVCGKPIRIGPLRYAVGTKRRGLILLGQGIEATKQEAYTCPSCGTQLYEKCDKCSDIRHSLLPFCEHCGSQKASERQ